MKTRIYADYAAFLIRAERAENGVSQEFADANPEWDTERGNKACWNCSGCSDCSGCSRCSYCSDCSDCSDCSRCSYCSGCSRCSDCSDCSGCSDQKNLRPQPIEGGAPAFTVPVIPHIHQRVLEAVTTPRALEMDSWHTCEMTHCRGGWVVTLAGEAGKKLEEATSTLFAAMQIYKASSPLRVSPPRFFESNEVAMADIKRMAALEAEQETPRG